jgi:hypothetical protein
MYSASSRSEYQKQKKKRISWGVERGGSIRLTTLLPSVSGLSRQCGILNISQTYRLAWPDTRRVLFAYFVLLANIFLFQIIY